jgi:hypothetical protein
MPCLFKVLKISQLYTGHIIISLFCGRCIPDVISKSHVGAGCGVMLVALPSTRNGGEVVAKNKGIKLALLNLRPLMDDLWR